MNLSHLTLAQADDLFQSGRLSTEQAQAYCRAWNSGPHFTRAIVKDGRIRNYDFPLVLTFPDDTLKACGVTR